MTPEPTTLVMAGAREAHGLVTALLARGRRVIVSLPEPERMFEAFPVPTRIGDFASPGVFAAWLRSERVETVIDASHVFDDGISAMAARAAESLALRYLRLMRAPWTATVADIWQEVPSIRDAARAVPPEARVFSNTGWATLNDYADFRGDRLFLRQTHPAPKPVPHPFVTVVEGAPPFTQFEEEALFRKLAVTHLICRNVGGAASMSKLLAARALRLPVLMVARRPGPVDRPQVETVAEALAWEAQA